MNGKQLKNSILQWAIQGRLVPQDPGEEPAAGLLERIRAEKAKLVKEGKLKKAALADSVIFRAEDNKYYERSGKTLTCIDDQIPFEIPEAWEWVRLKSICTFLSRGKSPKYSEISRQYPVFAQKCNLKEGGISLSQARFLDPSTISKWDDVYKLRNGDVLVNSTGTGTVGRVRLFHEDCLGGYPFVVPDSHVSVVRTADEISSEFVYACLSSKHIQQYLEDNLAGSTNQKELYIGILEDLLLPLPPLAEQRRIVAKVEEVLSVVERYERAQDELDALCNSLNGRLRKSILQEAIQGRLVPQDPTEEPAARLLERIREEKARLVKEGKLKKAALGDSTIFRGKDNKYYERIGKTLTCIDDQIPFEIPESWEWVRLCSIMTLHNGRAYKQNELLDEGKYPVLRVGNLFTNNSWYYSDMELEPNKYVDCGDLIYAWSASFGPHIWTGGKCIFHYHIWKIDYSSLLLKEFLFYLLLAATENIKTHGHGMAMMHVTKEGMENLLLPLPPLAEQRRIVAKVEELFAVLDRIASK